MNPIVSVIVPVYGVEPYLQKCVDGIIGQTYTDLEIILVDDGSPDNCPKICDDYAAKDTRIKVIHQKNAGLSGARNAGIEAARGDYITFVDSDDYIDEDYIRVMLDNLTENDCDISCVKHDVIYPNKVLKEWNGKKTVYSPEEALESMLYQKDMDVSAWGKMYRTEMFRNIRYPVGRNFEDSATTYKLIIRSKKIVLDSRPLYHYVIREASITSGSSFSKKMELIESTREMTDDIKARYPSLSKACERKMMHAYLSCLMQTVRSADVSEETVSMLISYIRDHRKAVLKDRKAPARDKAAIVCIDLGYSFFRKAWKLYSILRQR